MKYVIEHLEPEAYDWCLVEYKHISKIVGAGNLIFTNVKKGKEKLKALGEVHDSSVKELNLKNACVLDPEAGKTLSTADKKFDYLIFGGILGDFPPKKRTGIELSSKLDFEKRNLGKEQMSTDTAVYVSKKIIEGKKLSDIKFKDEIELDVDEGESVELPYRYVIEDGKPVLPDGFVEFLRNREEF
jgi:ribosome biogenesis SPOUT family RNA methylase Rps3